MKAYFIDLQKELDNKENLNSMGKLKLSPNNNKNKVF